MTTDNLYELDFKNHTPFELHLADGDTLYIDKIIRLVPHRRLVALARFHGQMVIAKLFFDPARTMKHIKREKEGLSKLAKAHIPTSTLYYEGKSTDHQCGVLLFEYLEEAETLEAVWQNKTHLDEVYPLLQKMMIELATQHVFGVLQRDLHFKNFLIAPRKIYTLDGASVTVSETVLLKAVCWQSIALFLSQLGVGFEDEQFELYRHYAKARGWLIKEGDREQLFRDIQKHHDQRFERYKKKIFRNSTNFAVFQQGRFKGVYDRQYTAPDMQRWLTDPESAFRDTTCPALKAGRSSTVIKVRWDGKDYVIKRHNMKSMFHWARRLFRTTRAAHAWYLSHKLKLFGVPVASPVAFLEKHYFGLHSASYYVTEYIAETCQQDFLVHHVKPVVAMLKNLAKLNITHNDLKMKNILVNARMEPVLIDLDGAKEHTSLWRLSSSFQKGIDRFLRNFEKDSHLYQQFKDELT